MIFHFILKFFQVRQQLSTLEAKVDDQVNTIKIFIAESFKKFMLESTIAPKGDPASEISRLKKVPLNYHSPIFSLSLTFIYCSIVFFLYCVHFTIVIEKKYFID